MISLNNQQTYICSCGSKIWYISAIFENNALAIYFDNMKCLQCGMPPVNIDKLDGGLV